MVRTRGRVGIGVDGCRAGWFWISLGGARPEFGIARAFEEILDLDFPEARIVVDIPIGLPDGADYPRTCDTLARRALGSGRGSSVFSVPCREALETDDIEEAKAVSRRLSGVAFSKQLWMLRPKILEVDRALRSVAGARARVRETHPEVAFWALNSEVPIRERKKSREGFERRLAVLSRYDERAPQVVEAAITSFPRSKVQPDDVVDAFVCALVAAAAELRTIPEEPPIDARGLPMEMCVPSPESIARAPVSQASETAASVVAPVSRGTASWSYEPDPDVLHIALGSSGATRDLEIAEGLHVQLEAGSGRVVGLRLGRLMSRVREREGVE